MAGDGELIQGLDGPICGHELLHLHKLQVSNFCLELMFLPLCGSDGQEEGGAGGTYDSTPTQCT